MAVVIPNKSRTQAEFHDTEINETNLISEVSRTSQSVFEKHTLTASISKEPAPANPDKPEPYGDSMESGQKTLPQRSSEIASLGARRAQQRQIYAKRPSMKRLTCLSMTSSVGAFYLNARGRKIEKVGNVNCPAEAKSHELFGILRLLVTNFPDGTFKHIHLFASSGDQILDDAASRIAQLASPFETFQDELRESTDELENIRTWQFRKNASLRSS